MHVQCAEVGTSYFARLAARDASLHCLAASHPDFARLVEGVVPDAEPLAWPLAGAAFAQRAQRVARSGTVSTSCLSSLLGNLRASTHAVPEVRTTTSPLPPCHIMTCWSLRRGAL